MGAMCNHSCARIVLSFQAREALVCFSESNHSFSASLREALFGSRVFSFPPLPPFPPFIPEVSSVDMLCEGVILLGAGKKQELQRGV